MNCWHCNTELRWVGDHDADELTDDRYTILSCLECPECKSWVEVYYPNPEHEDHKQKGELMKEVLVNAIRSHLAGNINKHLANIQVYMNSTTGIGEHSDIVETIELELEQVANYHDKLEMLVKYFIKPSTAEEETNDAEPTKEKQ